MKRAISPAILWGTVLAVTLVMGVGCGSDEAPSSTPAEQGDGEVLYWKSKMDPSFVSKNPGKDAMGMDLVPVRKGDPGADLSKLELSGMVIQRIGVRTAPIERKSLKKTIRGVARINYDETRLSRVNLKYDGWIEKLYVDETGERVERGQPLFDVYSPELVASAEEFLQVINRPKFGSHMEHLANSAKARLRQFDFSEEQIEAIATAGEVPRFLTVYAPRTGVVVHKSVVDGSFIKKGTDLFDIADLSVVWVDVDIYEFEVPWVREGQRMNVELSYLPDRDFEGAVDFIYPFLDTKTRTVRVRGILKNADRSLKPGMFATGRIVSDVTAPTLVIPSEAVIHEGDRSIAFVSLGEGRFEARELKLGVEGDGGDYVLLGGIEEGERIVLSGQFLIDSESRLKEAAARMLGPDPVESPTGDDMPENASNSGHGK
jgi:membrane fusion protein, copper/silver efflux system